MYKIPANTLFMGKNLVFVPECHSTNILATELSQKPEITEGTVVITDNQTSGKGQRGNIWVTEKGKNLTFSIILKPSFLRVKDQFQLNRAISLGVWDYLAQRGQKADLKWPNDVLINDKKVCGILIENQVQGTSFTNSIAGIGLNINQRAFAVPTASSLSMVTGVTYDLSTELIDVLHAIEIRYQALRKAQLSKLENDYLSVLYGFNEKRFFSTADETFEGKILGVDDSGRLIIEVDGAKRLFNTKEVRFEYGPFK